MAAKGTGDILDDKPRSSSSSASAEPSSQEPGDIEQTEHDSFANDHKQSEKVLPNLETSASSTLESPQVQTMERPPESPGSFATNNPSTPNRLWSIGSNESLFSIQNMSFTRGHFNMLLKSGDLGMYGDQLKSGDLENMYKSGELPPPLIDALKSMKAQMPTTPRDYIEVKEENSMSEAATVKGGTPSMDELPCPASVSRDTEAYAPSFASQVVGKGGRHGTGSSRTGKSERSSSVSSRQGNGEQASSADDQEKSKRISNKGEEATSSSLSSWLSCFSCCGKTS